MRFNHLKATLKTAVLAVSVLLLGAGVALAQQQVNLTAAPTTTTLPDGTVVPMWGYSCGGAVTGSTATCAALNPASLATTTTAATWSPVVITVPTGQGLTINLTNSLSFLNGNSVPTSLVIVGQLGGGLGDVTQRTTTLPPDHSNAQPVTWPIAGNPPGAPLTGVGTPPAQGPRVQSFSTEVLAGATTATPLTWPAATLRPGTYLIESGTHPSIQGPMGLYGILVVTCAPTATAGCTVTTGTTTTTLAAGTAYPAPTTTAAAITYSAEVPLLLSEIDSVQNNAVNAAVNKAGFSETAVWSGLRGGCGNPSSTTYQTCYPPAVNYTPLYYLFNGVAFNKTAAATANPSLFLTSPATGLTAGTGTVLVRFVNAGLRMHVPSIVGTLTTPVVAGTAVPGFSLIAEDGNLLPGIPRVQSEVFMAAGKTYDVMINVPAAGGSALPVFDRQLSLSSNGSARDAGMLAYIGTNGAGLPASPAFATATATPDNYSVVTGVTLTVSDPGKGVIANDINVFGVKVLGAAPAGLTLNTDGTFTYTGAPTSFTYCGNGTTSGAACALVSLNAATIEPGSAIHVGPKTYTSNLAGSLSIKPAGVLSTTWSSTCTPTTTAPCHDYDAAGYPLTVDTTTAPTLSPSGTVTVDASGAFNASVSAPGTYTFTYHAKNSQGTVSSGSATVTLVFPTATGLSVTVLDGKDKTTTITDYRWIVEEDRTFYVNPNCTSNPPAAGCPTATSGIVPTFGTNFHTSYMPLVAMGCVGSLACESGQTVVDPATGLHNPTVCDVGNGVCRTGASQQTAVNPSQVHLDPTKHYYISVLPGDAANPFESGNTIGGHGMGGAPIIPTCTPAGVCSFSPVTVLVQQTPFPPSKLSVFVFQDDFPLNGEHDGSGGIDVLSPNEAGLGQFNIVLFDDAGGTGDATGQMTYDMFNMPLNNSLAGTIDPATMSDACPISTQATNDPTQKGFTGTIVTCPKYESDGKTLSPLAGQAVVANLMPGRYGVVATPGADRIAKGEEWLQTNTLDGQKAHDSFLRIGEPSFFQEYGPAGYHVSIGFANPKIINSRLAGVCGGTDPNITGTHCGATTGTTNRGNTITGTVTTTRMSRTPDERLYSSGDNSSFAFTQCFVSVGDPDGEDFAFTKCDGSGSFTLSGLPDGDWRITVFDQWNDMLVDGLSTPVRLTGGQAGATLPMGEMPMNQWQANIITKSFIDLNRNGIQDVDTTGTACTAPGTPTGCNANYGNPTEPGLSLVPTNIRFRDGSYSNFNNTDLLGNAGFNEIFPLFSWYVVESDSTRFKNTGTHVVYDAGGPADGTPCGASATPPTAPCGNSAIAKNMANTAEQVSVPAALRVPGARYCASADCPTGDTAGGSTGRVDPAWVTSEGWQGFSGQNSFIDFGKIPFVPGETGGIHGEVIYASTRPFDDPSLLIHTSWTPDVPGVTINLYQEGTAPDGSQSLKLVDTTKTSSFDDWAQGFYPGTSNKPYMSCPGQLPGPSTANPTAPSDPFYFSLFNQPDYLDVYNNQHSGTPLHTIPSNSQFKCYDGMHNWNQVQPAPYDGMYQFPSVVTRDPNTGVATTACTICVPNPSGDGTVMLPAGKYVVEMVVPPGYELVKEEDKNILIGDNYIAPVVQQFAGLGSIYILPDQAAIGAEFNANNAQNSNRTLGRPITPQSEGDTGSVEVFWPCVGASRIVPDYISLFPQSHEVAPFAGATRNLCDRKEVTLADQASALAKFWVFTSTHVAAHFTGIITDDFTSEFDPFSPQFGEKFSPPNLPVSIKDWTGTEIARVYTDQWGSYDGMTYSTWEVNPPNPTGYAPTMMVTCMNDPGTGLAPDPLFNPAYSQFCYEIPFMPGQTQYMDTPVVPTSAFAGAGYNNVDCAYPTLTPAIKEVDGDGIGPWVSAAGKTLTITALGDQYVNNYAYSGPSATTAPYNQKTVLRHYGFGAGATVTIGGVATTCSGGDLTMTCTVPPGVPLCNANNPTYRGANATARCGELVITSANTAAAGQPSNAKQSIDTVTVTIGGKAPIHIPASASIQTAIDNANPGDMLMIDPTCTTTTAPTTPVACTTTGATNHSNSNHVEMVIMWKPIRLQGVGAASSIINANTHPAGKMDVWRRQVNCLFGLSLSGYPLTAATPYDPSGTYNCSGAMQFQVDRLPLEAVIGWDASQNGNMAELLQEPSLMGALEGAAITVLSKGLQFPAGSDPFGVGAATPGGFPNGTTLLQNVPGVSTDHCTGAPNYPSNFMCNPSSIDGLGITDSSHGGGGIFVHGWGHNIQIANNRVYNNAGTLAGGINLGQGEFPPSYTQGAGALNAPPGSCQTSSITGQQLPYCFNLNVNVHHNNVSLNSSTGDELFSATPAGAGGVSICNGSDYYKFNYNWVCGNLSTGDGGGVGHIGYSWNGRIEHNSIIFNQSTNPTIASHGGGLLIMGAPDVDPACGTTTDADCLPPITSVNPPGDGTGPGLVINANLIMGNAAESGSGGGIRFQGVNGTDVTTFPTQPSRWYSIDVTNNIIANNVAGWDGAGISLVDSLAVNIRNNTIISNDTTASSGVLFNTLNSPLASTQGPCPYGTTVPTPCHETSEPQPAGLVAIQNSTQLFTAMAPLTVTCPTGHYSGGTATNANCKQVSYPLLANDVFWQNRAYYIAVPGPGTGTQNQQNLVTLYNGFSTTTAPNQTSTGACTAAAYWDIGVRGDTGPTNHGLATLNPTFSILTNTTGYNAGGSGNSQSNPNVVRQYCNGSRIIPEAGTAGAGWQVPPGIADATVPNPIFNLTPNATVDEGNNWVNISWGPLSMSNPATATSTTSTQLGNYSITPGSPAVDHATATGAPTSDFFGNSRPQGAGFDIGAVELGGTGVTPVVSAGLTPTTRAFGGVTRGSTSGPSQVFTLTNTGNVPLTGITQGSLGGANATEFFINQVTSTCGPAGGNQMLSQTTLAAGASCTVTVQFRPLTTQPLGAQAASVSVTDAAGTQTSTLSGTAN